MKSILILTRHYLPGYKGGGPIRTISNMVKALGNEFKFSIITTDRDLGDKTPYESIKMDTWIQHHNSSIIYLSPTDFYNKLKNLILNYKGDAINLNSFFSFRFSIIPLLFWLIYQHGKPIILGPRGEFSEGALSLKSSKKKIFIFFVKKIGLYKNVTWQASTEHEASDIRRVMGPNSNIKIALNIAQPGGEVSLPIRDVSEPLRIIFISRISPKKNLLGAIKILKHVKKKIIFDAYGPKEDEKYWTQCQSEADSLPKNVSFNYCGMLHPNDIPDSLARYDLFFFPTLGENFGHVIAESLSAGLPVLISDMTPWCNLEEKSLGWDVPLNQPKIYAEKIEECTNLSPEIYLKWRKNIRDWATKNIGNHDAIEQNRQIFTNQS